MPLVGCASRSLDSLSLARDDRCTIGDWFPLRRAGVVGARFRLRKRSFDGLFLSRIRVSPTASSTIGSASHFETHHHLTLTENNVILSEPEPKAKRVEGPLPQSETSSAIEPRTGNQFPSEHLSSRASDSESRDRDALPISSLV